MGDEVLSHITALKAAISAPATRVLTQQALAPLKVGSNSVLGLDLAGKIAKFAVPKLDFDLPPPPNDRDYGSIDLVSLRRYAQREASRIPNMIETQAVRRR